MFDEILGLIKLTDESSQRIMPPSELYNEAWLLRLVMHWFSKQTNFIINSDLDRMIIKAFKFQENSRYYTNATLETPFKKRYKDNKDPLAESNSQVGAVLGHFTVKYGKKREKIVLKPDANQFVVIDAKLYKELNKGIKCATHYNQVARTIACMVFNISNIKNITIENTGYFVIIPKSQIGIDSFRAFTYKKDISEKINNRVEQYGGEFKKSTWFSNFNLIFQRIEVECITWEDLIQFISKNDSNYGNNLLNFYQKCRKCHGHE